ncbi:hypothetical protein CHINAEXTREME_03640 [Halobiforma lacisalsi AJ5]|uniref:Uncharacterized protein n=2 Tax=Natronobacterium lacisalsi TaxID=229731 RepID=M0LM95_NATLA|nr:hypothetical protein CHINAEXTREME_03640 [Halobiforma lacisalsi AJ5]EMA34626.1 hypothetical protein C445_06880 [Halobiforma lacisalsi AJ5]
MGAVVILAFMSEQLKSARDDLEQAEKTADDEVREDIRETADAFADYVVGDHAPDHAVMDQHLNDLRQLSEQVDGNTEDRLESALEAAEEYREGIDQA